MSPANAFHEVATKVFKNTLYIDVFIIGNAGWGVDTKAFFQRFLVGMHLGVAEIGHLGDAERGHLGDAERGTTIDKVSLHALVITSWKTIAGEFAVKTRDATKFHQKRYNECLLIDCDCVV